MSKLSETDNDNDNEVCPKVHQNQDTNAQGAIRQWHNFINV